VRCPAEHAALGESAKHIGYRIITTLYLLNHTRVKMDEHGSYNKVKCAPDLSGARADRGRSTVTTPWSLAANMNGETAFGYEYVYRIAHPQSHDEDSSVSNTDSWMPTTGDSSIQFFMRSFCPCEFLSLPGFLEISSSCLSHLTHLIVWLQVSSGINRVFVSFTIILSLVSLVLAVGDTPFLGLPCPCNYSLPSSYDFNWNSWTTVR
jgi:hypothetical protein